MADMAERRDDECAGVLGPLAARHDAGRPSLASKYVFVKKFRFRDGCRGMGTRLGVFVTMSVN
jgi:hypothetical protein